LGAGGKNLKNITAKTNTRIDIPRSANQEGTSDTVEDDDQPVTIVGDFEGVKQAKEEIEAIVAQRTSKLTVRLNIERSYHPFIAGPNSTGVQLIELETGVRVHIPPVSVPKEGSNTTPSEKNVNEILIVGDREGVRVAEERVKQLYESLQRTTRTLSFPVKKRQHRFIIGPKGASLQEILQTTGCSVELPPSSDPSDIITVRGPDNMLSVALQAVLQKANEITIEEVDVISQLPKSTDSKMFLKFLFTKERAEVRKIETAHNVTIHQMNLDTDTPLLEIQGKSKPETDTARLELASLVKEMGSSLFFGEVEIPHGLHKFVVGKGGQNIAKMKASPAWEGRLVDVIVPNESEESDDVLLVVRRPPLGLAGASGVRPPKAGHATVNPKVLAAQEAEVQAFVDRIREEIVAVATTQADFVVESVPVPSKYHGRLIGSNGDKLKELLGAHAAEVSVKFPSKETVEGGTAKKPKSGEPTDPNTVFVKGPKKEVAEVKERVLKLVADLKHIEVISSFSDVLKVKKGLGKKLVQGGGSSGMGWLIRAVKDAIAATPVTHSKPGDVTPEQAILNLRVEVDEKPAEDVLTIVGPKVAVSHAKTILNERATRLADQTIIEVKLFSDVSAAARAVLAESALEVSNDIRKRVLRRLIGKEGKGVKALMENHAVFIQFPDRLKKKKKKDAADDEEDDTNEVAAEVDDASSVVPPDGLVTIKGNIKDVDACKKEILKTVEAELVKSFVLTFRIPKHVLPHVVGSQGSKIRSIKDDNDVRVDLNDIEELEEGSEEAQVEVVIEGSKAGCHAAQAKILEAVDELVSNLSKWLVPLEQLLIMPHTHRLTPTLWK
jgi:rRNA processing protein Krr1/Pno1